MRLMLVRDAIPFRTIGRRSRPMNTQADNADLVMHRLRSITDREYDAFLGIYRDSQPENELKSPDQLARMIASPEYYFLAALRNHAVVGFSISICFTNSDAALLEYMAVARELRGLGIGQELFRQTVNFAPISERITLVEVDSEK